ncbi:MAG: hypothetical protein H0V82_01910 [Candidatus Protochlamydia sp.]|nr:hypothetical protein [Candidatus Protochlamydia sp.]
MNLASYINNLIVLDNTTPYFAFLVENKKWAIKNGQLVYQLNPNYYDLRPFALVLKKINEDLDLFNPNSSYVSGIKINSFKTLLESKVALFHEKNSTNFGKFKKIILRLFFGDIDDLKNKIIRKMNEFQRRWPHRDNSSSVIPVVKTNALNAYMENPVGCSRNFKSVIFLDIQSIAHSSRMEKNLTSVESYLKYISGSNVINLKEPVCIAFVRDCFKELNKETSIRLVEWLIEQNTFNVELWGDSISGLLEREKDGQPLNPFSIEKLIGFYRSNYEALKTSISVNDPLVLNALSSLINIEPNNDRVIDIATWVMNQNEFDISSCEPWLKIFQAKERQFINSPNLYYPLLNLIVAKVKQVIGEKILADQIEDHTIKDYLNIKLSL